MSHPMSCHDATPPCSLSYSSLMTPMASAESPATHKGANVATATVMSADVSKWRSPSVLIQPRMLPFIPKVVEYPTDSHKDETFEDADDNDSHYNPLCDLGKQVAFDDSTEAESDDGDDDRSDYGSPNRKSLDKFFLFHIFGWLEFRCSNWYCYATAPGMARKHLHIQRVRTARYGFIAYLTVIVATALHAISHDVGVTPKVKE